MMDLTIMRKGPSLTKQDCETLCLPVSETEIEKALFAIGDDFAPLPSIF